MDAQKKKQLREQYANRMPDIGVISFRCKETGESFLGVCRDYRADYNSQLVRLSGGTHPNKRFLELWNLYGEEGFEIGLIEQLEYEDPSEDYSEELEALRELCLEKDPKAQKIWK